MGCVQSLLARLPLSMAHPVPASSMPPLPSPGFNIAIVGAGIGGLGLAIGLSHLGVPFTIYESAPAFSAIGAGIGLGPNALVAMDLIDSRFRQLYMDIATGNLNPEKKHVMMEAMLMEEGLGEGESWWGHGDWGSPKFTRTGAHRKDLLNIMTSFIAKDAVRFNKRVVSMTQEEGLVTLEFDDGDMAQHAAVVASDGVNGFSRRIVLEDRYPENVKPVYTNKYVYRAVVPMDDAKAILGDLATDAKMYMGKGANVSTYPIAEGRLLNVVAFKRDERPWMHPSSTYDVSKAEMLEDFVAIRTDARLLKLLDWAKPTRWGIFHHPTTPTYSHSLICLLGDVAHAGGPHQAAGAGQCLEDSLILSRVLGKLYPMLLQPPPSLFLSLSPWSPLCPHRTKLIEAAFTAYDLVRRPRAQDQVRTTLECGDIYTLCFEGTQGDMGRILANLNHRFAWIWEHDLEGDVRRVEERFAELVGGGVGAGEVEVVGCRL